MKSNKQFLLLTFLFCLLSASTMQSGNVTLVLQAGDYDRSDCTVSVDISDFYKPNQPVALYEIVNGKKTFIDSQVIRNESGVSRLFWVSDGVTPAGTERTYLVKTGKFPKKSKNKMAVNDTGKELMLEKGGKPVLAYHYGMCYPPEGVSSYFKRSGFIHPAYSPKGYRLTRIQAPDHYHHYGIWNPWTRVSYDNKVYDLWNLGDKQGTVRADENSLLPQGEVLSGYTATLNHVAFLPAGEKVIMKEKVCVKAWNVPEVFLWDFESTLMPSTPLPVTIQAYRYAGFSWRATEEWTRENCVMMTSEGKTRQEIDGSNARWIYITGESPEGNSGILFLSHPDNYNHPEPLRIWDENANGGRGDAFINFSPTKTKDWELKPNGKYTLRYRVVTYDGEITPERSEQLWIDFAYPPVVLKR